MLNKCCVDSEALFVCPRVFEIVKCKRVMCLKSCDICTFSNLFLSVFINVGVHRFSVNLEATSKILGS